VERQQQQQQQQQQEEEEEERQRKSEGEVSRENKFRGIDGVDIGVVGGDGGSAGWPERGGSRETSGTGEEVRGPPLLIALTPGYALAGFFNQWS